MVPPKRCDLARADDCCISDESKVDYRDDYENKPVCWLDWACEEWVMPVFEDDLKAKELFYDCRSNCAF